MHIKSTLIALSLALLTGWLGSIILSDTAFASPSDGKTCLLTPFGGLERCPYGAGINDLSTAGYVLVPSGSQCFKGDEDLGEDTPNKFACDFNSPTERDSVQVFAHWTAIRDKAITDWKKANPGKGNPTEGQIYTFINTNVYAELTPQEEDIINQDCSQLTGINKTKCEAVKACVENDPDGNIAKCTDAWATCMDGSTDESKANECADQVSALGAGGADSNCNVEGGLGWILCPMLNTMASLNDAAFGMIQNFLMTPALNTNTADKGNGVYVAWTIMRDFANAAFVIVFLLIIFSQVSNIGVSNYGIKKMLPKLIIGAVLVNTSYWISALLIDLSNVVGSNIYELFNGISERIPVGSSDGGGLSWVLIVTMAITGVGVAVMVGLSVILPLIVSAIILTLGLLVALAFRHSMVIFLIVISPLAFVAYLLPNTERMFKMWWGLLKILLLLYPIIALLFGTSLIAARVIYAAGLESDNVSMMAFGAFLPFIAMLGVKGVFDATKGILGRIGFSNPFGGAIGAAKGAAKSFGQTQDDRLGSAAARNRFMPSALFRSARDSQNQAIRSQAASNMQRSGAQANAQAMKNSRFRRWRAGLGAGDAGLARAQAQATQQLDAIDSEDVKNHRLLYEDQGFEANQAYSELQANGANLDSAQKRALRQMVAEGGNAEHIEKLWNDSKNWNNTERNALAQDLSKNKVAGVGQGAIAAMRTGNADDFRTTLASSATRGAFSPEVAAKADESLLKMLHDDVLTDDTLMNSVSNNNAQGVRDQVAQDAHVAYSDPRYGAGKNRSELMRLANLGSSSPGTTATTTGGSAPTGGAPGSSGTAGGSPSGGTGGGSSSSSGVSGGSTPVVADTTRAFTREQLKNMGPENIQKAIDARADRGGIQSMSDGDVLAIANTHGNHQVGQAAKAEAINRQLITPANKPNLPAAPAPQPASAENIARQISPDSQSSLKIDRTASVDDAGVVRQGMTSNNEDLASRMNDRFTK